MLIAAPAENDLRLLTGDLFYQNALLVHDYVNAHYTMDAVWDQSVKSKEMQCRYRRGGKTLCTIIYKQGEAACMMIFGAAEREKVPTVALSSAGQATYDAATTYHDGKWVWFSLKSDTVLKDIQALLPIKRRLMK